MPRGVGVAVLIRWYGWGLARRKSSSTRWRSVICSWQRSRTVWKLRRRRRDSLTCATLNPSQTQHPPAVQATRSVRIVDPCSSPTLHPFSCCCCQNAVAAADGVCSRSRLRHLTPTVYSLGTRVVPPLPPHLAADQAAQSRGFQC